MTAPTAFRGLCAAESARLSALSKADSLFVAPRSLSGFSEEGAGVPRLVLVADNPGAKEFEDKEYLSPRGASGRIARAFFDLACGEVGTFGRLVMVLNRSSRHTPRTQGLEELVRKEAGTPLGAEIEADQRAFAAFAVQAARLARAPVLEIGGGASAAVFAPWREAFALARLPGDPPAHKAPHFSHSQFFRTNADAARNARIQAYLSRWEPKIQGLRTPSDSVSSKALLESGVGAAAADFLASVIFGGTT